MIWQTVLRQSLPNDTPALLRTFIIPFAEGRVVLVELELVECFQYDQIATVMPSTTIVIRIAGTTDSCSVSVCAVIDWP